jgi:hypothetical protein
VKAINKLIIPIFIIILLSVSAYAQVATDINLINQLNERLERNKAEILKAIKDYQNSTINATSASMDSNFETLDGRIQDFFKASKRDFATIMVIGFLVGFVVSQIIRLAIERARRRNLMRRGMELEAFVERLGKESKDLTERVKQLKVLDSQYTKELKSLTKKEPFISLKMVLFGIITLLLGVISTYFLVIPHG